MKIELLSYNIHKGFTSTNKQYVLNDLRDSIRKIKADIVFVQEAVGLDSIKKIDSQLEFLADQVWPHHVYGKNSVYDHGHHGNALLSRFPIIKWSVTNISTNIFEDRGLLHCELKEEVWEKSLHCFCTHLSLFGSGRRKQVKRVIDLIKAETADTDAVILAGDFNDWTDHTSEPLRKHLGMEEASRVANGNLLRTFPARLPILPLDRIYIRNLKVTQSGIPEGLSRTGLSDHLPIKASLTWK